MPPMRPSSPLHAINLTRRALSTSSPLRSSTQFSRGPAPPRLSKEEQEIFETLQKQSSGAFSTPREASTSAEQPAAAQQENGSFAAWRDKVTSPDTSKPSFQGAEETAPPAIQAAGSGEELHPHMRRGAKPEFQGETNPKTGEVGGPKNEPLRWGDGSDWSYNGRVTDF